MFLPFQQMRGPLHRAPWEFFTRWYFKCFCFLGCVDNFRLMWFENSVKYRKPFSPQPTQFPEKPATQKLWLSFNTRQNKTKITYLQSGPDQDQLRALSSRCEPEKMLIAICLCHSYLGWWEQTDLKVHFSHSRQAESGGPQRTPGCAQGRWGTWRRPARSLLGLRWALSPWRPGGGLCRPDRNLTTGERGVFSFFHGNESNNIADHHFYGPSFQVRDSPSSVQQPSGGGACR